MYRNEDIPKYGSLASLLCITSGQVGPKYICRLMAAFAYPKHHTKMKGSEKNSDMVAQMAFFTSAVTTLQTLVVALGAGLAVWGVINLLEGYGSDNAGAKSQGMKHLIPK